MKRRARVGSIVHYRMLGTDAPDFAAIVTFVYDSLPNPKKKVNIKVFPPSGKDFEVLAPFSKTPKGGHWFWPPKI